MTAVHHGVCIRSSVPLFNIARVYSGTVLWSRDGLILLDLKGAALHRDVITAVDRRVHELGLSGHVALYTLPESKDMTKQWHGQFICGYKASLVPPLPL